MRRELPVGPVAPNHGDSEGEVRLAEMFTAPDRPLVLYHSMFGKQQEHTCPMWADGWNAIADHLVDSLDFAMVNHV